MQHVGKSLSIPVFPAQGFYSNQFLRFFKKSLAHQQRVIWRYKVECGWKLFSFVETKHLYWIELCSMMGKNMTDVIIQKKNRIIFSPKDHQPTGSQDQHPPQAQILLKNNESLLRKLVWNDVAIGILPQAVVNEVC